MIKLRPYQEKAVRDLRTFFAKGGRHCILQAPTGSGKTVIFSVLSKLIQEKGNKILILTDRIELLLQAGGTTERVGLQCFYITAGTNIVSNNFNVYIAMSQTFRRRIGTPYWHKFLSSINLIIIDECHKQEFNYLFESRQTEEKNIIGFTATPMRAGHQRQLGLDYEEIIKTVSIKDLIYGGFLVNDDYYGLESPDMSEVEIDRMKGDYKERQMFAKFNSPQLYAGIINNYKDICPGTKALVFCVNIEHVIQTTIKFNDNGIRAKFVTSKVSKPKPPGANATKGKWVMYYERLEVYKLYTRYFHVISGERDDVFNDFKNDKFEVLVNAGIATTGYDCPSIETIILNRATLSLTLLLQMIGRGSRPFEGKTHFNILDFGGNCQRLGFYSEEREWFLWHDYKKSGGLPPIKECGYTVSGRPIKKGGCRRLILTSYTICPFCGFKYPEKKVKEISLQNVVFDGKNAVKTKKVKDMSLNELHNYWKIKNHKPAWLWRQLYYKGGINTIKKFGNMHGWKYSTIQKAINYCKQFK
jgi:superfamily II DNA or RNA helicase